MIAKERAWSETVRSRPWEVNRTLREPKREVLIRCNVMTYEWWRKRVKGNFLPLASLDVQGIWVNKTKNLDLVREHRWNHGTVLLVWNESDFFVLCVWFISQDRLRSASEMKSNFRVSSDLLREHQIPLQRSFWQPRHRLNIYVILNHRKFRKHWNTIENKHPFRLSQ